MLIEDKPNLERVKRALTAYNTALAARALNSSDKLVEDFYNPETKATDDLIKIVDENLKRISEYEGTLHNGS